MQEFFDIIEVLLIVGLVLWVSRVQARVAALESKDSKGA